MKFSYGSGTTLHSISPTSHRPPHSIFDRPVGMHTSEILVMMKHVLSLRHYCLLENHTISLYNVVIVHIFWGLLECRKPVIAFLFLGILTDLSLSKRELSLVEAIFLICATSIFLLFLTSILDRRSHQS